MSWGASNSGPQVRAVEEELADIYTDELGFNTISGETKLRLAQPWPADKQPPLWASLLSVASTKGLLAAATSESLILTPTDAVREAYYATDEAENKVKPFTPQISVNVPQVSHVAFSSDETLLVIAAQEGGGLAIYDVQALLQGNQNTSAQLATNGIPIRALAPNPAPEYAHLFAIVLTDGKLMIADLKQNQMTSTANGPVFSECVRCVSWSNRGKQLVAGMTDGTAAQYDPQGNLKAQVPRPPQLGEEQIPMSAIVWIANDDFLVIHTPQSEESAEDSQYHLLHREKASGTFTSQKFSGDPCMPGMDTKRFPSHYLVSRLRKFPPHLEDALILCSSSGTDAGLITNSTEPLSKDTPITNTYAVTDISLDTQRVTMPMSIIDEMSDTAAVGMDIDLSSKENVAKPIPADEMDHSETPLPALMIFTNEGLLCTWWFVYNASVRQKVAYPGLVSAASTKNDLASSTQNSNAQSSAPTTTTFPSAAPAFGQSSFGQPPKAQPAFGQPAKPQSAFGQPAFGQSAFGQPAKPTFGTPSASGFGGASAIGTKPSVWGSSATNTTPKAPSSGPVFGSSLGNSSGNVSFGSTAAPGNKAPAWASSSPSQQPAFGQAASLGSGSGFAKFTSSAKDENKAPVSPFAAAANNNQSASPFAAFAKPSPGGNTSPFAKAAETKSSPFSFGKPSGSPTVATQSSSETKEEVMEDETDDKPQEETPKTDEKPKAFSLGQSTDKAQPSPFASVSKPQTSGFGSSTEKTQSSLFGTTPDKPKTSSLFDQSNSGSKSPLSVFNQPAKQTGFQFGKPSDRTSSPLRQSSDKPSKLPTWSGFKLGSGFQGDGSAKDDLPAPKKDGSSMFGSAFSSMLGDTEKNKSTTTTIKKESEETPKMEDIPKAGTDDESEVEPEEAPLPPDFTASQPKQKDQEDLPPIAGSPPVDLGEDASQLPASDDEKEGDESWVQDSGEEEEGESESDGQEEYDEESEEHEEEEDEDETGEDADEEDEASDADEEATVDVSKAAQSSFGSRLSFPSMSHSTGNAGNLLQQPTSPVPSTTPAGLPKAPFFAPPTNTQESPRSPSPIRPAGPSPADRSDPRQKLQSSATASHRKGHTRSHSRPSSAQRPESPKLPEAGELSDDEDVRVREILQSAIEPSKNLEPFIAHQDYVGHVSKPGIAGQIEKVYRDINSMIDTLGLNARAVQAFVSGHDSQYKQAGRERSDLENAEDWCLAEVKDLGVVQKEIGDDLDNGKVDQVSHKLDELADLQKEATRLRTRTADMRKQIGARADPQQRAVHRASPLNAEAQMQQTDLRDGVAKVQRLLHEAEQALSVLRADLAGISSVGTAAQRAPTVEAVTNTIMKMTAMIEQKSGDVDMLEAQLRRLPGGLANLHINGDDMEDSLRSSVRSVRPLERSLAVDQFSTPPRTRGKNPAFNAGTPLGHSGMFGRFIGSVRRDGNEGAAEGTPRRKMADVSAEEVKRYQDRMARRKTVLAALKQTIEKKGPRQTRAERR